MISLTRLSGSVFVLNADLIERLDNTPDTVVTLVDGKKYVVCESLAEIVASVRIHRAEIITLSTLAPGDADPRLRPGHLAPVTPHPSTRGGGD